MADRAQNLCVQAFLAPIVTAFPEGIANPSLGGDSPPLMRQFTLIRLMAQFHPHGTVSPLAAQFHPPWLSSPSCDSSPPQHRLTLMAQFPCPPPAALTAAARVQSVLKRFGSCLKRSETVSSGLERFENS